MKMITEWLAWAIGIMILAQVVFISFELKDLRADIHKIQNKEVHYLLPKPSDCAVKVMYFQDATGDVKPAVRTVCHWENR